DAVHRANTITTEAQQASAKAAIAAHETAVFIAEGKLTFEQGLDEATHATTYKAAIGPENPVMLGPSLLAYALAETFRPARAFLNANVAVLADEGGPGIRGFSRCTEGSRPTPCRSPSPRTRRPSGTRTRAWPERSC